MILQQIQMMTKKEYDLNILQHSDGENDAYGLSFNSDGTKMFVTTNGDNSVYELLLSEGFDITQLGTFLANLMI